MSAETVIICDGCSLVLAQARTALKARLDVIHMGGAAALPGGRDLCPDCKAKASA